MITERLRRFTGSFLAIPTAIIVGFILLAAGTHAVEQSDAYWLSWLTGTMGRSVFGSSEATSTLLGTIATAITTVTSITFSLLLVAVQQSAGSMTSQILDQFAHRRFNQVAFGFFVGLSVFTLVILASVSPSFNPVLGASLVLILTVVALFGLLILIYQTINQMRPPEIVRSIHDHTLRARERHLTALARTRRESGLAGVPAVTVLATSSGFLELVDLDALEAAIKRLPGRAEVESLVPVGGYVATGDPLALVRVEGGAPEDELLDAACRGLVIERDRQLPGDPAYGIEQLETIGWRASSSAQHNPATAIVAVRALRDLMARWADEGSLDGADAADSDDRVAVVLPDGVPDRLMDALESMTVATEEGMQHQVLSEVVLAFTRTWDRLPVPVRDRAEAILLGSLAGLGEHRLTARLDAALVEAVTTLRGDGRAASAGAIAAAREGLAASRGTLNSRSTRVPGTVDA